MPILNEGSEMNTHVYKKRYILFLLVFFAALNLAARYPLDHPVPHGSDTLTVMQLSDSLSENDQAGWTLTLLSYFGLYPLSYPSGMPFLLSEASDLSGLSPNAIVWIIDGIFSILLLLAGFMLFRTFRISDETAVIFAGLMAMTPFFLYYTYGQAATRGLLIPITVFGLLFMFWKIDSLWKRIALFSIFTILAFAIHRTAVIVVLIEGVSFIALSLASTIYGSSLRPRVVLYCCIVFCGLFVLIWPFIPGLNEIYTGIPEVSSSFYEGELEFRTGYFFEGDSPIVILANLGSNYVGSMGLVILLLPLLVPALYPRSFKSSFREIFVVLTLASFMFVVWKVQYMQLLIIPFLYLAIALAVDRVKDAGKTALPLLSRVKMAGIASKLYRMRRWRPAFLALLVALSIAFSVGMLSHRGGGYLQPVLIQHNWPTDATVSAGIYVGNLDCDEFEYFVSNGALLNRRIAWFSDWDCVVNDPIVLNSNGYLSVDRNDFIPSSRLDGDFFGFLELLYKTSTGYNLNPTMDDYPLYFLSMNVPYGLLYLYLENESYATIFPHISSNTARIGVVVQLIDLEGRFSTSYADEGIRTCGFLAEVSEKSYCIFVNEEYRAYLAATPVI